MTRAFPSVPCAVLSLLVLPAISTSAAAATSASTTGMTIAVTNCKDSGPGSLRNAVARALSGDTVDMSGLACNTITLAGGAIVVPQQDLDFQGPGRDRLTIKGSDDRVFDHQGSGLLRLRKFSVANGGGDNPFGGCIHAQGRVELRRVRVHHCRAGGDLNVAGGGIYAVGDVSLYDSAVEFNVAAAADTPEDLREYAEGGGIYSGGRLRIERSHVCDNAAEAGDSRYEPSYGGGAYAVGGVTAHHASIYDNVSSFGGGGLSVGLDGNISITNSTIARNTSGSGAGGVEVGYRGDGTVTIRNSTFSGNMGGEYMGLELPLPYGSALDVAYVGVTTITNSTIAFNRNASGSTNSCGGAIHAGNGELRLTSTIIADNACDNASGGIEPLDIRAASIEGSRNLVQAATPALPADTIIADPQLLPLAANGGSTKTHAPRATSPAVAAGANPYGLLYDQRGAGYPRVRGARADIGAHER